MPTLIDVKMGSEQGDFSLVEIQNLITKNQEFDLTYYVVADTISQDAVAIAATAGLPQLGSLAYTAYCQKVTPRAVATVIHFITGAITQLWEVDVHFTTTMRDPSNIVPQVNYGGELDEQNLEADVVTGAKPLTTAGEPIFIKQQVPFLIIRVRRQEPYPWNPYTTATYCGKVNLTSFYGFPQGTCLMLPILVEEDTQDSKRILWVTYEIKVWIDWNYDGTLRSNTWQERSLNQGQMVRKTVGGDPQIATDKGNRPIKVNLDGDGLQLTNSSGTLLKITGSPSSSLNRFKGVQDANGGSDNVVAKSSDVGSQMVIDSTSAPPWNPGTYTVTAVGNIPGTTGLSWILDGDPGTVGSTSGIWKLVRAPIYLPFNKAYYIDFNALNLGPY